MSPFGYNIGFVSGAASGVVSGVLTLVGGLGTFFFFSLLFVSGFTCGGAVMLKILAICFRSSVLLLPNVVIGIVGARLRRECVGSAVKCVAAYFDYIIVNVRVDG